MPALSFWDIAAKRPSCLMAVTPYRGGTWASMLKPGVAMPSPVMRDFSTEPAKWYDFLTILRAIGTHDFKWSITFKATAYTAGGGVFFLSWGSTIFSFGVWSSNSDQPNLRTLVTKITNENYIDASVISSGESTQYDEYMVEISRSNGVVTLVINGVTRGILTGQSNVDLSTLSSAPTLHSNYACNIPGSTLEDLTTNKVVWSYPTWAEDKRLLTLANVRTDRGVFEAANASSGWTIKTQVTGTVGTVIERRPSGVYVNSGKFNASTGIYTGLAADQLLTLLAFDYTLTAAEIAQFK